MSQRPTVSVVTPSFNQAEYLDRTIRSVLTQSGQGETFDLQYIVVDGGSQDGSAEIIRGHQESLAYWCSEPDRGQTHAINKGMAVADGDIRCYLNSDDTLCPGALKRVVEAYQTNPDCDLFHGVCQKIDQDDRVIGRQCSTIRSLLQLIDLWDYWLRPGDNKNFIQPEVFWTRRLSDRIGRFDESLHYTMDFDYWLRAFDADVRVHRIDEPLASFRVHEAQKTSDRESSISELIADIEPFLQRHDDPRLPAADRRRIARHANLCRAMMHRSGGQRLRQLLVIAKEHPGMLRSPHYWKQVRRSARAIPRELSRAA